MKSSYVDTVAIMQVIGNVFNDPTLLDLTDKYVVREDDFVEDFHKIVFGSIYNIHLKNSAVNINTIIDYLENRPKYKAVFDSNDGIDYLMKVSSFAQQDTFNYYYNRLKKMTLLRAYEDIGLDVGRLYDPSNVLDTTKKQEQEEWLDSHSLVQISDAINGMIDDIKIKYAEDERGVSYQAAEGALDLIESLERNPEAGIPMYGALINSITRGARLKRFYLRSAATGTGKALRDDDILPTPDGFRRVADIKPGDYLFGSDGNPTKVLAIHPQPEQKEIWKIHFQDGRIAECSGDHLWSIIYAYYGKGADKISGHYVKKTMTTREARKLLEMKSLHKEKSVSIEVPDALQCPKRDLGFDPCHFGRYIAGDNNFADECEKVYPQLKEEKIIPDDFLFTALEDKMAFFKGLVDVCGLWEDTDRTLFYFAYPPGATERLKESLKKLIWSAGFLCSHTNLRRVKAIAENAVGSRAGLSVYPKERLDKNRLRIENIVQTGQKTNMTCFTVEAEDHLFLMGDFILTHNTRTLIADACYFACDEIYDENFGWIKNGKSYPTLFISTEQELSEVQTMMIAFVSNVNEEHILNGRYEEGERERVIRAVEILNRSKLWIELLPDFSLEDIENVIKKNIRENDATYICLDYLHTSMKILEEITNRSGGVKLREDNVLFMISTRLKDICLQYGVFIISSTQLSGNFKDAESPDQNLLRGAKSIADKIDVGLIMLTPTNEDLVKLEPVLASGRFDAPNIKISVYKNRRGKYKGVYLWAKADLGTCRVNPMFCTTFNYDIVTIDDIKILVAEEDE